MAVIHPESLRTEFALHIAAGGLVAAWYKAKGIPKPTAYRWYRSPEIKAKVAEYRRRAVDRAIGRMAKNLGKAVSRIIDLIETGQTDAVKLSAAKTLVDKLIAVQNHAELTAELKDLNKRLAVQEARRAR
jgi:hypothetical protein